MRTIKFRGKDVDSNEWVYGFYIYEGLGQHTIVSFKDSDYTQQTYTVEPITVGQFTGMLDDNDKEIYEGDIVKGGQLRCTGNFIIDNSVGSVVQFKSEMFKAGEISLCSLFKQCKVVGNIFDDSELFPIS